MNTCKGSPRPKGPHRLTNMLPQQAGLRFLRCSLTSRCAIIVEAIPSLFTVQEKHSGFLSRHYRGFSVDRLLSLKHRENMTISISSIKQTTGARKLKTGTQKINHVDRKMAINIPAVALCSGAGPTTGATLPSPLVFFPLLFLLAYQLYCVCTRPISKHWRSHILCEAHVEVIEHFKLKLGMAQMRWAVVSEYLRIPGGFVPRGITARRLPAGMSHRPPMALSTTTATEPVTRHWTPRIRDIQRRPLRLRESCVSGLQGLTHFFPCFFLPFYSEWRPVMS